MKALRFWAKMESYGDKDFGTSWYHDKLEILKSLDEIREQTYVPQQSQQKRNKSLCVFAWFTEKSTMMVTIQLRRIINAYPRRSTKSVLNRILRLSIFRLQNSSHFNAPLFPFQCQVSPLSLSCSINICIWTRCTSLW